MAVTHGTARVHVTGYAEKRNRELRRARGIKTKADPNWANALMRDLALMGLGSAVIRGPSSDGPMSPSPDGPLASKV